MVRPLDVAWSILKSDFHLGYKHGGHFARAGEDMTGYAGPMYERPVMRARRRVANFPELSDRPATEDEKKPFNTKLTFRAGPKDRPNFPAPEDGVDGRYYRGGSVPRLREDGSYVGTHLYPELGKIFEEDFDKGAEKIANIGAHENVHSLIEDEVERWAKQQSNIDALKREQKENIERLTQQYPPQGKFSGPRMRWNRPKTATDVLVRAGVNVDPYDSIIPELLTDLDVEQAEGAYPILHSMAHEFGAYSLTPDSSSPTGFTTPEQRLDDMGDTMYQGAEFYHPDPELRSDISELHMAGPSEDQIRYEQMLQEQQAAGDVNPQTSVQ